jgi:hypothetical protein
VNMVAHDLTQVSMVAHGLTQVNMVAHGLPCSIVIVNTVHAYVHNLTDIIY